MEEWGKKRRGDTYQVQVRDYEMESLEDTNQLDIRNYINIRNYL